MTDQVFKEEMKMSIESGVESFRSFMKLQIESGLSSRHFDLLINYLEDLPEIQPEVSLKLSEILIDLFPENEDADPSRRGGAWHFRILSLLYHPEPVILLKGINQALDYCELDAVNFSIGYMICHNAKLKISPELIGEDTLLLLYKRCMQYFKNVGELDDMFDFLFSAASVFSRLGAYQSAERLLNDGREIAEAHNSDEMRIKIGFALGQAAIDQQDHLCAEEIFESIINELNRNQIEIPDLQLFNLGLVKMRIKKTDQALKLFTESVKRGKEKSFLHLSAMMHQGICHKDLEDWTTAELSFALLEAEVAEIVKYNDEQFDNGANDLLIEFELVYALILATNLKPEKALKRLNIAALYIERAMEYTVRPHYRKRIRSQYQNRILAVIALVWESAKPDDLLSVFIGLKTNTQSDWLSIITWIEYVQEQDQISAPEKDKLNLILEKLHRYSGMILGPYQEKYDDPFEFQGQTDVLLSDESETLSNLPWQDFSLLAYGLIHKYRLYPVFHFSSVGVLKTHLTSRLQENYILLFTYPTKLGYTTYVLSDNSVYSESLEFYHFKRYQQALLDYRGSKIDWTEFASPFADVVEFIDEQISLIWDRLSLESKKGIYLFSGVFDSQFPLPQACLSNTHILERLGNDDFIFVQCPVMFPEKISQRSFKHIEVLINRHHELGLFQPEAKAVVESFPSFEIRSINDDSDIRRYHESIAKADVIHFITHGRPISRFNDPFFASLAGNTFSVGTFQLFHKASTQLYFISACNAADTVNPPAGLIVSTNEIVGYTTVLMQNRLAKVIGCKWPLLDRVGFVFSSLFYKILVEVNDVNLAYGKTVFQMARKDADFFLPLADHIEAEGPKSKFIAELKERQRPFDRAFLYTSMNLYSLI